MKKMTQMKRWLTCAVAVLLLTLCAVALSVSASAATSGYYTYTVSNGKATITDVDTSISGNVTIPSTLGGYPVTKIGSFSFQNCSDLASIEIPSSVTLIGDYAFYNCSGLTNLKILEGVTSIGYGAFSCCRRLENITVAEDNTVYHDAGNCLIETASKTLVSGWKNSVIPTDGSVNSIGPYAFYECHDLTSIDIPLSVTNIGQQAFGHCSVLTSIEIPSSVTSIANDAFYGCSSLESISVANGNVTYYDDDNCLIESVSGTLILGCKESVIPTDGSVTSIGKYAFAGCQQLEEITIPNCITSIGDYAFSSCFWLNSIEIPENVQYMGQGVFSSSGLKSVKIAKNSKLKTIPARAFWFCKSLSSITFGENCELNFIDDQSFYNCSALKSVSIPSEVITIGSQAFYKCTELEKIIFNGNSKLEGIGRESFFGCGNLTDFVFPSNVKSIGSKAFLECGKLTGIDIPEGVDEIGELAFSQCGALESISLPLFYLKWGLGRVFGSDPYEGSIQIDSQDNSGGFYLPANLKSVTITGNGPINEGTFYGCSMLVSVMLPEGITSIGDDAFSGCINLKDIDIPSGVTNIGSNAFFDCGAITNLEIPDSVISIGRQAFDGCSALIEIKNGIKYVDRWAIGGDNSLTQLYFGENTVGISDYAFYASESVDVKIGSNVGVIGKYAFALCEDLISVNFEKGSRLKIIDDCAFFDCINLEKITLPSSVLYAGKESFYVCSELTCPIFLSGDVEIFDSPYTLPETDIITFYGYTDSTVQSYATKYDRTFVSIGDFQPAIKSANITLGADITVYYYVMLPEQMKDAVMKFTAGDKTAIAKAEPTATPDRYVFAFKGITPQMMGDSISVSVIYTHPTLGELEVANKAEYSVKQYCTNMISKVQNKTLGLSDAQYAALGSLLADTLEYGAAAQVFMGHNVDRLMNEGITGQTAFVPLGAEYAAGKPSTTTAADGTRLRGATAILDNTIRLKFTLYAADIEHVSLSVNGIEYSADDFKATGAVGTDGLPVYELVLPSILASELEYIYDLSLRVDGVECQTYSYGLVNYLYSKQNDSNEKLVDLIKAIRNYGLSATAYQSAMK